MAEVNDYGTTPVDGSTRTRFVYDGQGRRIQKTTETYNLASDLWTLTSDTRFLYDGWNLIAEYDTTTIGNTYVWGHDLSGHAGSPRPGVGAGGVGGLLFTSSLSPITQLPTSTHAVSYDANGNISEYIDLSTGTIEAHLEYDAFGRIIHSTGTAPANFGFSTKYLDEETNYLYYGFRYYDPEIGKWPNRDPIEESGGTNMYGFVWNDGVNLWDYLGMMARRRCCTPGTQIPDSKFQYGCIRAWIEIRGRRVIPLYGKRLGTYTLVCNSAGTGWYRITPITWGACF
jgi:RHS repeat-associated protein